LQNNKPSAVRVVRINSSNTVVYASDGARALGIEVGRSWPAGSDDIFQSGKLQFAIAAETDPSGERLLVLNALENRQRLHAALQCIASCSLVDVPQSDGKLGRALARVVSTLNEAIKQSLRAALQLDNDAEKLTDSADQSQSRATAVARQLEQTLKMASMLDNTIHNNLQNAEALADETRKIDGQIETSRNAMNQTSEQMQTISEQIRETQHIVEVIEEIAFNTTILSINASLEAARAGNAGRGFSVVAQEVRSLARHTSEQATVIRNLLQRVQDSSGTGQSVVQQANDALEGLFINMRSINERTVEIRAASTEQARSVRESTDNLQGIATLNEQNAELAENLLGLANKFRTQTGFMRDSLEVFKLQKGFSHPQHEAAYQIAQTTAQIIGRKFEAAIASGKISSDALFDRRHQAVPGTNPVRYATQFDQFCDRLLPEIQEPALQASEFLIYLIATDNCGYVPTHNTRFCQPLTGDPETDLRGNRTKRVFTDRVGQSAGAHTKQYLLSTYRRDTGEVLVDLSCPIFVNGQHWGGVRAGYAF